MHHAAAVRLCETSHLLGLHESVCDLRFVGRSPRAGASADGLVGVDERAAVAEVCVLRLNMAMPMLLDDMTDQADGLYNALPERLYLIDGEGIVRFKTVAGAMGFKPEDWAAAIAGLAGPTALEKF